MGRKKQKPRRSVGILENGGTIGEGSNNQNGLEPNFESKHDELQENPNFVEIEWSSWDGDEHWDLSEIVLTNLNLKEEFLGYELSNEFHRDASYGLRFRLDNANEHIARMKLNHWPIIAASDVHLEFLHKRVVDDVETWDVMVSGCFDGHDEEVTGVVHLASLKFLTLRPVLGVTLSEDLCSIRVRVEILQSAFDACESLLESSRQLWKKSMMSATAWLRPEMTTSEARYGVSISDEHGVISSNDMEDNVQQHSKFDVGRFYEAIKPSKNSPMLEDKLPDLLPELRPYQRRAAYWMIQREKGASRSPAEMKLSSNCPLCVAVNFLDSCSQMFYNPVSGNISLCSESPSSYVSGGILADEMGLGKTVELLACVFGHPKSVTEGTSHFGGTSDGMLKDKVSIRRVKRERVECVCGALNESHKYKGLWVQCDICDAWQHAECVSYSAKGKSKRSKEASAGKQYRNGSRNKNNASIVEMDGEHICQLCSELIEATSSPVDSGATLIVCPAPILPQWAAEISRHTNPGSLRTFIYEGVRDTSLSNSSAVDISELVNADIVLTTYDVLKEDLSHDSDRHEGDRRLLRYEKRYPVTATVLTRIFWWRICLDEAQMVESNATAATEMAMRLHGTHRWCVTGTPIQRKLDDLYGLIRFLKAGPFDVYRWWVEVIRDPYERGDYAAMEFTHDLFRRLMWRSSKAHVADELQLPPQEESLSLLSFSPVEEHFYQRQHETCLDHAREVLNRFKSDIINGKASGPSFCDSSSDPLINHAEATKLLNSLLKLRQACCHPQVGGSGLRALQRSPMTMDEILSVLISKTKVEGEEALRKVVSSLNGLAGIAIIRGEFSQAVSIYKEALDIANEHCEDFRLDPLLNLHIHHNLAEILTSTSDHVKQAPQFVGKCGGNSGEDFSQVSSTGECDEHIMKKRKITSEDLSDSKIYGNESAQFSNSPSSNDFESGKDSIPEPPAPHESSSDDSLIQACENIKKKYLSVFYSRLSQAQQEFQKSYMQVSDAFGDGKEENTVWWLEALCQIEQNEEAATDLNRKIENAVLGSRNMTKSPRIASRFRSINALKYYIQTSLDALEESRKRLLDQLMEIDQTMEKPRDEDVERVRYCPNCYANPDGLLCIHCELDELFQDYEARLFLLKRDSDGRDIASAEEALDLQKKRLELNHFYSNLAQKYKNQTSSSIENEDTNKRRDSRKTLVVSRSPSQLEIILGVIRSYCRAQLGREGVSTASRHLLCLEGMRKEYAHARSLATAQAQVLRAYDEIKMAASRLRLRENDDDNSIDALSLEELDVASVENSSEKFMSLASLSRIKGKLRYLQGLVQSKQKTEVERDAGAHLSSPDAERRDELIDEICPVCQENLQNQRMVFQCGHVTCAKCLFAITERNAVPHGKLLDKWVICPTCRQHSDFDSIAFADDSQNKSSMKSSGNFEASVTVQGSYGTKIEAVTRRILWIKLSDPNAKVLVFSSWNDVLDVLEHAFTANQISYIRMKGGRKRSQAALSIFKGEKSNAKSFGVANDQQSEPCSVQVLLLLIQYGANGLNLLEAQHVILVEPLLNSAAEAQAISRVHRIGQTNKTLIHRFIVKDTVEESIYKLNKSRNTSSFISGNKKNQDQPVLTLKDVESLFAAVPENREEQNASLMHLPPAVAAAVAAERRLNRSRMDNS